jgi:hypothetical protein
MKNKYNWANHLFNFLAVIIGVYLAFYMNERARQNHDRREGRILMQSLINDLSEDIKRYQTFQIPANFQYQEEIESLINLLIADSLEGFSGQLPKILGVENFAPTTSTYASMKASGKIGLIEDLTIRKKLTEYYEGIVVESTMKGEYQVDFFTRELMAWIIKNVDLVEMRLLKTDDLIVLRNNLIMYQSIVDQKVRSYEMIVEDSSELIKEIESLLK